MRDETTDVQKNEWQAPTISDFEVAELTKATDLSGGDLQTGLGDDQPGS